MDRCAGLPYSYRSCILNATECSAPKADERQTPPSGLGRAYDDTHCPDQAYELATHRPFQRAMTPLKCMIGVVALYFSDVGVRPWMVIISACMYRRHHCSIFATQSCLSGSRSAHPLVAMSEPIFSVSTYVIPASHIREYHGGARSPAAGLKLRLEVKRYTPCQPKTKADALTIIATHANGIPKESYEPLWDALLRKLPPGTVRGIWIADCVHQGASAALNEGLLGDEPSWFDHARDLAALVNQFAAEMPLPIVGIGHSMGCTQLLRLSSSHPRLMCGLALVDAIVQDAAVIGPNAALKSSYRRDWWPSRAAAEEAFRASPFFQTWNEDALRLFIKHGLRDTPTEIYPESGGVTLATSKAQEAWSFLRGHFADVGDEESERRASPGADSENKFHLFTRPEMTQTNRELPSVRPNVLYVFGEHSPVSPPLLREDKMKRTGTGVNGNGGVAAGNVEAVTIKRGFHMLPMERIDEVAVALAQWLETQRDKFIMVEQWHQEYDRGISDQNKSTLSKEWMEKVRLKESTRRNMKVKL